MATRLKLIDGTQLYVKESYTDLKLAMVAKPQFVELSPTEGEDKSVVIPKPAIIAIHS